ncbi:hypothetical protein ACFQVC_06670 [Streptomyces monticola]|uniref:Uncharacterized protein n=1 Tax=Streptomyces monticola TaxID=2666263 RepID=A0ABW2JDK9_9ACTN
MSQRRDRRDAGQETGHVQGGAGRYDVVVAGGGAAALSGGLTPGRAVAARRAAGAAGDPLSVIFSPANERAVCDKVIGVGRHGL